MKIIFTDIDGTITKDDEKCCIPYQVIRMIETLNENDIRVVFVTGRSYGWCKAMIELYPILGIIGENGAFYIHSNGIEKVFSSSVSDLLSKKLRSFIPFDYYLANDQFSRCFDVAIDLNGLNKDEIDFIQNICKKKHISCKISSIHINCWIGNYDKLYALKQFVDFNCIDFKDCFYIGDSPNDAPIFKFKQIQSVAVGNIINFDHEYHPSIVYRKKYYKGFLDFCNDVLENKI